MISKRLIFNQTLQSVLMALFLIGGLAWTATAVEGASLHGWNAIMQATLTTPGLVIPVAPLICAIGSGFAAARSMASGEREGWMAAGHSPTKIGVAAMVLGFCFGAAQLLAHETVVPWAESARTQSGALHSWVWLEDEPIRVSDGLRMEIIDGNVTGNHVFTPLSDQELRDALQQLNPSGSPIKSLNRTPASQLEFHRRLARIIACAAWAWLAWLPWGTARPVQHIGRVLAAALTWFAMDLVFFGLSSQGHASTAVGGWGATGVLMALLAWSASKSR